MLNIDDEKSMECFILGSWANPSAKFLMRVCAVIGQEEQRRYGSMRGTHSAERPARVLESFLAKFLKDKFIWQ